MNNRLSDIPKWALEDSDDDENGKDELPPSKDVEAPQQPDFMEDFFRHVDSIKADIDAVQKATRDISKISEQSMRATTTSEEQKLSKKLRPLIDSTNQRAKKCKHLLGLLKEDTASLKKDGKVNASDIRWVRCSIAVWSWVKIETTAMLIFCFVSFVFLSFLLSPSSLSK